jgi:hypothetical protein
MEMKTVKTVYKRLYTETVGALIPRVSRAAGSVLIGLATDLPSPSEWRGCPSMADPEI